MTIEAAELGFSEPPAITKRKRRSPSSYLVLKEHDNSSDHDYRVIAEGKSVKAAIENAVKTKPIGSLLVACVRKRLSATVEETVKLS